MTNLEKRVREIIADQGNEDERQSYMQDVMSYGCQSGIVGQLIYYTDTVKFYNDHKEEINEMLSNILQDTGCSEGELFGDKWDNDDPLALDQYNQNLLAWFGFEETTREICESEHGAY